MQLFLICFFKVVKKHVLIQMNVNPECCDLWPKCNSAQCLTSRSFTVCERTVPPLFLRGSKWFVNHFGGTFQMTLYFMFTFCDLQNYCCADKSSTSAFNSLTVQFEHRAHKYQNFPNKIWAENKRQTCKESLQLLTLVGNDVVGGRDEGAAGTVDS